MVGSNAPIRFSLNIALRRTVADWRLQVAAAFGMVLAVALMAAAVIYSDALKETALQYTFRNTAPERLDIMVGLPSTLDKRTLDGAVDRVNEQLYRPIEPYVEQSTLFIRTSTFFFDGNPRLEGLSGERPRGPVHGVSGLENHVRLLEGRMPIANPDALEVVIDPLGASLLEVVVGDQIGVYPALQNDGGESLKVELVGIFEPTDPEGRYWKIGYPTRFAEKAQWNTVPLYADPDELVSKIGGKFVGTSADYFWFFFLDRDSVNAEGADVLRGMLPDLRGSLFSTWNTPSWESELELVLDRYSFLLLLARIPLFLLVFLAIGMLLYYIFLIAGLLGRVRAAEVALFRSRGASLPQVGLVMLLEGILLAIPSIIVGPFLAQALVIVTGTLFPAASGGTGLSFVNLSPTVFLVGSFGAALGVMILVGTTLIASRQGVVALRRSGARPPQMPFIHRYYLDIVLLVLIVGMWFQLKSRGSFFVSTSSGDGVELDVTLLLFPVLGVLGVGLILFRVFPLLLKSATWPLDAIVPIWLAQGMRRIARDPIPAGSMLMLVALATALGMLASTFTSTLERSQKERAHYDAGADLRVHHSLVGTSFGDLLLEQEGITSVSDVVRLSMNVLAIDSETFAETTWFRDDFSDEPLDEIINRLKIPDQADEADPGIRLPEGVSSLGIWLTQGIPSGNHILFARLRDSQGRYFDTEIGVAPTSGWEFIQAPIKPVIPRRGWGRVRTEDVGYLPTEPYSLHLLWVLTSGRWRSGGPGAVFLDQLTAFTPTDSVVLASFQNLEGWHTLEDATSPGLFVLEIEENVAREGRKSAFFSWGAGSARRGIRAGLPEKPILAVVSSSFLSENAVRIGDETVIDIGLAHAPIKIVGELEFLPTLHPETNPFVLTDINSVVDYLALRSARTFQPDAEVWVNFDEGSYPRELIVDTIEERGGVIGEVFDTAENIGKMIADPLLAAGWSGLLALSFVTVVLASSSALILYTYIDARERSEEFAMMRTLGFSKLQVNGVLWFNLGLITVTGILVGTWTGRLLASSLLPLLEVAELGRRITPPMVLETNWWAMASAYSILAVAALGTVGILAWAISHLDIQRVLRAGGA